MSSDIIEKPYPFQETVGFTIEDWHENGATLHLPLKGHLDNRYGILHGGVHATLLDTAMGFAVSYTGDANNKQLVMTLSLNVNYLGVASGDMLIATGRKTGGGRSTAFAEGEITDASGNIVATATGVFRYRKNSSGKPKSGETP